MINSNGYDIIYKGVGYRSIKDLAQKLGLNATTISSRLRKGYTLEQAVELRRAPVNKIVYNGKLYSSYTELITDLDVVPYRFHQLLKQGYSLERVIERTLSERKHNVRSRPDIVYKGVKYKSYKDLAEAYNINYSTLLQRLQKGLSLDEAIRKKMSDKDKLRLAKMNYNKSTGEYLNTTINNRVQKMIRGGAVIIRYKGVEYTLPNLAKYLGVSLKTLRTHLLLEDNVDKAIANVLVSKNSNNITHS